jgi:hypothetical protein
MLPVLRPPGVTLSMPPQNYKTYAMRRPLKTHWQPAACEDVDCPKFLRGWVTTIDESSELGQAQAHYIRHDRSRSHAEERTPEGLTRFTFKAGQVCFGSSEHRQPLFKDPVFLVKGGDWRGNPRRTPTVVHRNGADWQEDFAEHQDRLKTLIERG